MRKASLFSTNEALILTSNSDVKGGLSRVEAGIHINLTFLWYCSSFYASHV